jgi:hypothetical protein
MSANGLASSDLPPGHAINGRDSSSALAPGAARANPGEADVLRNALSAVMLEYHEQSKKLADVTAQNLQLCAKCSELERRLFDIESSGSWLATRRFREFFARHPRLHRVVTAIRVPAARP